MRINKDTVQTLLSRMGTGGNQTPLVANAISIHQHGQNAEWYIDKTGMTQPLSAAQGMGGGNDPLVAISVENHSNDSRVKIREDGKSQTLSSRMGTGGNNEPLVATLSKDSHMTRADINKVAPLTAEQYKEPPCVAISVENHSHSHDWKITDPNTTQPLMAGCGQGGAKPLVMNTWSVSKNGFMTRPRNEKVDTLESTQYKDPPCVAFYSDTGATQQDIGLCEEQTPTLRASSGGKITVLNDQGGGVMSISEDKTATLRSQEHGHAPLVVDMGGGKSSCSISENQTPTLTTTHDGAPAVCGAFSHLQGAKAHGLGYAEEQAPTLRAGTTGAVVTPTYCIQGNTIDREVQNGGNGKGVKEEKAYTLNTIDRRAVAFTQNQRNEVRDLKDKATALTANPGAKQQNFVAVDTYNQTIGKEVPTLKAKTGGDDVPAVVGFDPYNSSCSDKQSSLGTNCGISTGRNAVIEPISFDESQITCPTNSQPCKNAGIAHTQNESARSSIIDTNYKIRRITPTECARLQGFPDSWAKDTGFEPTEEEMPFWRTILPKKSDKAIKAYLANPYSESAEYKMWGNGVALPCVWYVIAGIKWNEEQAETNNASA